MGSLMESWDEFMRMYGPKPGGPVRGTPGGLPGGTPGEPPSGTPDGNVRLAGRSLSGNEFRKLLEDYFREHGNNPRGPDEFERWLDSRR